MYKKYKILGSLTTLATTQTMAVETDSTLMYILPYPFVTTVSILLLTNNKETIKFNKQKIIYDVVNNLNLNEFELTKTIEEVSKIR